MAGSLATLTTSLRPSTSSASAFTAALALTTPFVPSPTCINNIWDLKTTSYKTTNYSQSPSVATFPLTALAGQDILTCQLSGWSSLTSASHWTLSPAVCPSDWTAYRIATTYVSSREISTAYCCGRDFTFYTAGNFSAVPNVTEPCTRWFSSDATVTLSGASASTTTVKSGLQAYPAMKISWHKNDTTTMSPQPPTLTNGAVIFTWVPGTEVNESNVIFFHPDDSISTEKWFGPPLYWFLVVGLPVIFCLIVAALTWCCCVHARTKREKRRNAAEKLKVTPPKYEHSPANPALEPAQISPKYGERIT